MGLYGTVYEINDDVGGKKCNFSLPQYLTHPLNFATAFSLQKTT